MKKQDKFLLATFDYELFLGKRSGNILECLIEPTNKIVNVLNNYNIQGIFFVDVTYLLKMEEFSHNIAVKKDLSQIKNQLFELIKNDHLIFPHIHPHWEGAIYNEKVNQWDLNKSYRYKFSDLNDHEQEILFSTSINFLKDLIIEAGGSQKVDSYRAGGWSLQPFKVFKKHFKEHGIKNDFSVLPSVYQFSQSQSFDYSNCKKKSPYKFENDVCQEDENGAFIEFPISIIQHSGKTIYLHKLYSKYHTKINNDSTFNRGIGQAAELTKQIPDNKTGIQINEFTQYLSIDFLSQAKLKNYRTYCANHDFVQFLTHPKLCTNHSIKTFNKLLHILNSQFNIISNYKTIQHHYIR